MYILKRFFALSVLLALLSSCEKPEEKANKIYVGASAKIVRALEAANNVEYSKALDFCMEARQDVNGILEKYPSTRIALDIVKSDNLNLGPLSFNQLNGALVENLTLLSEPQMQNEIFPWAVALSNKDSALRDEALKDLAFLIIRKKSDVKDGVKKLGDDALKMVNICISAINSYAVKSQVIAERDIALEGVKLQGRSAIKSIVQTQMQKPAPAESLVKKVLTESKYHANLVNSDLASAAQIKTMSPIARAFNDADKLAYKEILELAYKNASRITVEKMRNTALFDVASAAANAGQADLSFTVMCAITDHALIRDLTLIATESFIIGGKFEAALEIISKIPDEKIQDKYFAEIAIRLAKEGRAADARNVAKKIKDIGAQANCIVLALCTLPDKNLDTIIAFLKSTNPARIDSATVKFLSDSVAPTDIVCKSNMGNYSAHLSEIVKVLATKDKSLAAVWALFARDCFMQVQDNSDVSLLIKPICENMSLIGEDALAFEILQKSVRKIKDEKTFYSICDMALSFAAAKKFDYAKETFSMASSLLGLMTDKNKVINASVYLAWQVQMANLDKVDSIKILSPFLPKL